MSNVMHTVDAAAAGAMTSAPLWWTQVNAVGQLILLILGIVFAALRIFYLIQDGRKGNDKS